MALRFYNTLSQQVENFTPLDGKTVRMYTCGPTVWNYVHIGNLRTFTSQDILRRWLQYRGYQMMHVMNITDVDDRIIQQSAAAGKSIYEYTAEYEKAFFEDASKVRLQRPEKICRATEHIEDMVRLIQTLEKQGFTYSSEGSIYFRISSFPEYGKLAHLHFEGLKAGARVDSDKYDKDNARDFVLWKARKEGEHFWETPLGPGRPGWHIECSAMAMRYLGETLDIHAGGVDLIFPHHENEVAQSEAATGKPFARFWIHTEHLMVESQTMSKSAGNFYTLRDLFDRGFSPESVRYLLAQVPYRKQLNFTLEGLKAAATAIERLRNYELRLKTTKFAEGKNVKIEERTAQALKSFEEAMDDDLNTAEALGATFEYVRETNTAMDTGEFLAGNVPAALDFLAKFDSIFAVLEPSTVDQTISLAEIEALIAERTQAKKARNFQRADEIRQRLLEHGIVVEDTKEGVRWKRK
ncbi:MAG: cysteine--tRNA ligase [Bryobacteraceae bacterium]|nr:cysteine--tRNA ligase [Bryobacteraceae bacterium]MDW8376586.1 cysteine--tRNA ligase [Bryobacterales bacterium]